VRKEAQRARCGDRSVLLAQRSSCGVARIGELSRFGGILGLGKQACVEGGERRLVHIHLAAHLEHRRRFVRQVVRNVADRPRVRGDDFADRPVAAGQREDKPPVFVAQRAGQSVDLGLRGQRHRLGVVEPQEATDPREEFDHFVIGKGVFEAHHRPRVRDLGEMLGRCRTDLPARRIGADQVREGGLDRHILANQRVIIRIRNLRRILGVVQPVMPRDLIGKESEPFGGGVIGGGQGGHRDSATAEQGGAARASPLAVVLPRRHESGVAPNVGRLRAAACARARRDITPSRAAVPPARAPRR
jgi:hypothetical protein